MHHLTTTAEHHALPHDLSAPRVARHWVDEFLDGGVEAQVRETVALLTSEAVTNAVLHGAPPVRLKVSMDPQAIEVEVADAAPWPPGGMGRRTVDDASESGRGLAIIDALSTAWGAGEPRLQAAGAAKSVWFRIDRN